MKARRLTFAACAALALAFAPGAAPSQDMPDPNVDALFPVLAAQGGNGEIALGRLALARGNALEVRGFAQKMIDEHTEMAADLARVAPGPPPREPLNAPDRLALERLRSLPAADFDRQYVVQQIGDHLATIGIFETEARLGRDAALRAFAERSLPTLRAHLQLAVVETKRIGGDTPFYQH